MLTFLGSAPPHCDGLSRRHFLTVGGLALGGLSLVDLLRAEQSVGRTTGSKSIIMIYMPGGPPHQDMLDLKPDAPAEFRGEFKPIDTAVPGIRICELMPLLAQRMKRFTLIRSIAESDGSHSSAQCTTGWRFQNQPPGGWPSLGSVVAAVEDRAAPLVPPSIDLTQQMQHMPYNLPGAGFLRPIHAPFRYEGPVLQNMHISPDSLNRLGDRKGLRQSFDRYRKQIDSSRGFLTHDDAVHQALDVLTSRKLADAFDLEKEPLKLRERYGHDNPKILPYSHYGYGAMNSRFLMARRLVEAGARVVTLSFADFDWHGQNFEFGRKAIPLFDKALTALVDDLHDRGLDQDVSVIAWGEFGRTPKINANAGRDHWPQVNSAYLACGGMKTGQVIGATTRYAETVKDRPVHYQEVFATLYRNIGIEGHQTTVQDMIGNRPRPILGDYQPIKELV